MDERRIEDLISEELGPHPAMQDYNIREDGDIVDIKFNTDIESIELLPLPNICKIFADKLHGDYGLSFTDDPPEQVEESFSDDDEGVYVAVIEEPTDVTNYVYLYGLYFDVPALELVEAVEELDDRQGYGEFLDVMSDEYSIDRVELADLTDEQFTAFESEDQSDVESAFEW